MSSDHCWFLLPPVLFASAGVLQQIKICWVHLCCCVVACLLLSFWRHAIHLLRRSRHYSAAIPAASAPLRQCPPLPFSHWSAPSSRRSNLVQGSAPTSKAACCNWFQCYSPICRSGTLAQPPACDCAQFPSRVSAC